ncbi:MAG: nucleotidyltransferase domain-containing protein [Thermodesulfobacteriota bacterium]|nr:nucleotidyltransferase domain-containing protein [Thermodesulfobacteriota bacterium]
MGIDRLVNDLKDYLLSSNIRDNIAKVIIFGSHAKGIASPGSDIDVLIFTTNGVDNEKAIMDRVYDFMIEHNAPLEVLISGVDALFINQDYFTYNITCYGWEIYSMEKDKIKTAMLKDLKNLAE